MMENAILLHSLDSEKLDLSYLSLAQIINLTCVQVENVSEIKITAELNYHVLKINLTDVLIKLAKLKFPNVNLY